MKYGVGKWRKTKDSKSNHYEGEYVKDKKQGFGIFRWASGNSYRGQYVNDEREGIGEMRWTDGSVYIGEWARGIQNGYGKMTFPDGTIKEGIFVNNVFKSLAKPNQIPEVLRNQHNFNILNLAPPNLNLSEESKNFNPGPRVVSLLHSTSTMKKANSSRFNSVPKRKDMSDDKISQYAMPPIANKSNVRSRSKEFKHFKQKGEENITLAPITDRKDFRLPSRSTRSLIGKRSGRSPNKGLTPSSGNLERTFSKYSVRKYRGKIWKPSGVVHYQDNLSHKSFI